MPISRVLDYTGRLCIVAEQASAEWSELYEHAYAKYHNQLDDELIVVIDYKSQRMRCLST